MTQTEKVSVSQLNHKVDELTETVAQQAKTLEIVDRGITTLILAVKGNDEYNQAGIVQNLNALSKKVEVMHADLESLKATKLRAVKIGAWVLGGLGTAATWVWNNLDKIGHYVTPAK